MSWYMNGSEVVELADGFKNNIHKAVKSRGRKRRRKMLKWFRHKSTVDEMTWFECRVSKEYHGQKYAYSIKDSYGSNYDVYACRCQYPDRAHYNRLYTNNRWTPPQEHDIPMFRGCSIFGQKLAHKSG